MISNPKYADKYGFPKKVIGFSPEKDKDWEKRTQISFHSIYTDDIYYFNDTLYVKINYVINKLLWYFKRDK